MQTQTQTWQVAEQILTWTINQSSVEYHGISSIQSVHKFVKKFQFFFEGYISPVPMASAILCLNQEDASGEANA